MLKPTTATGQKSPVPPARGVPLAPRPAVPLPPRPAVPPPTFIPPPDDDDDIPEDDDDDVPPPSDDENNFMPPEDDDEVMPPSDEDDDSPSDDDPPSDDSTDVIPPPPTNNIDSPTSLRRTSLANLIKTVPMQENFNKLNEIPKKNSNDIDFDLSELSQGLNIQQLAELSIANSLSVLDSSTKKELSKSIIVDIASNRRPSIQSERKDSIASRSGSIKVTVPRASEKLSINVTQNYPAMYRDMGFVEVLGRFQGDEYETLFMKLDGPILLLRTTEGNEMEFNLTERAYLSVDINEATRVVMDYHSLLIYFQFQSSDQIKKLMESLPKNVFALPAISVSKSGSSPIKAKLSKSQRTKGMSIEDLLEGPFNESSVVDLHDVNVISGHKRKELIDDHIKKPKYSLRRVKQICKWINSLHIWHIELDNLMLAKEMCSGILLTKLMKVLLPNVSYFQLNEKPRTQKAALENLEQALGIIWRSKAVNTSRIPTSLEIFSCKATKVAVLLQEIFEVYVCRPLYKNIIKTLKWYDSILQQYLRPLPEEIFEEGDLAGIWPHFQNGTSLFCIIYHTFGQSKIGSGDSSVQIDPHRMHYEPKSIGEFRSNIKYVFSLLTALNIEVMWDVDDWLTYPDTEVIMLQLQLIYDCLKDTPSSLPPAQGNFAGITSGPFGMPLVVGLIFADTHPVTHQIEPRRYINPLLGNGDDALTLLPIDASKQNSSKYFNDEVPKGMRSNQITVKVEKLKVDVTRVEAKSNWNNSNSPMKEKETKIVDILKQQSKSPIKRSKEAITTETSAPSQEQLFQVLDSLEKAMQKAMTEIDEREEELASKYLDLEQDADDLEPEDYEIKFNRLESEARTLEDDKIRLQEHFAFRFKSVKSQHEEAINKSTIAASKTESVGSVAISKRQGNLNTSISSKKEDKEAIEKQKAILQKGWLGNVREGSSNYHISKMKKASEDKLIESWTPFHKRGEKSKELLSPTRGEIDKVESHKAVFNRFKIKLNSSATKWLTQRHEIGRDKLKSLASLASKHQSNINLIGVPYEGEGEENAGYASIIREEEMAEMEYEDERRRIVLEENSLQRLSGQSTKETIKVPGPRDSFIAKPTAPPKAVQVTAMDVNNAFKFLSVIRQLLIADRTKKEYFWIVAREESNDGAIYTLQWREEQYENAPVLGSVTLTDIETINYSPKEPLLVTLILKNSIFALKNSGGRTHVAFICNDSDEALNYYSSIQTLIIGDKD